MLGQSSASRGWSRGHWADMRGMQRVAANSGWAGSPGRGGCNRRTVKITHENPPTTRSKQGPSGGDVRTSKAGEAGGACRFVRRAPLQELVESLATLTTHHTPSHTTTWHAQAAHHSKQSPCAHAQPSQGCSRRSRAEDRGKGVGASCSHLRPRPGT